MQLLKNVEQISTPQKNTQVVMVIPVPNLTHKSYFILKCMVLTQMLLAVVVGVAPLAPAPTSAEPWPPGANMAPEPNSVPGSPF